jgi:hypothetical protein
MKVGIKFFDVVLLASRLENKEEEATDLVIPLNKFSHNKPEVKGEEDVQRKKICKDDISTDVVGGEGISSNSLEETAVREILEGWCLVYCIYLFILSSILSNQYGWNSYICQCFVCMCAML